VKRELRELVVDWFLENEYDLFFKMEECQHGYLGIEDNPYHMEGNIWKHTRMVLDEVEKMENPSIELYLIALLHDIGKPFVYFDNHETKRRRFTNHESYSVFEAKRILDKFSEQVSPNIDKEVILKTIANHGRFYNYMKEDGLTEKGKNLIFQTYKKNIKSFDYMANFFHCDHYGRITDLNRSGKEILKDFKEIREKISNNIEISPQELRPTLRILVGPPRSGKSTFVKENAFENVISRDIFVEERGTGKNYSEKWNSLTDEDQSNIDKDLQKKFQSLIKNKKDIVIDMTNMSTKSRRKWIHSCKDYYKIANVFIESLETLKSRNSEEKTIDEKILKNMIIRFVYPMTDEFDEIIYEDS